MISFSPILNLSDSKSLLPSDTNVLTSHTLKPIILAGRTSIFLLDDIFLISSVMGSILIPTIFMEIGLM